MVRGGASEVSATTIQRSRCAVRLSTGVVALACMHMQALAFFTRDDADCAIAPVRCEFSWFVGNEVAAAD